MHARRLELGILAILLLAAPAAAETRSYAGPLTTAWKTRGPHGHDQPPCAERRITHFREGLLEESPNCDRIDFARGNLDNSIGFRAGREKDLFTLGPLSLVGGAEASLMYTEYNLSQGDFVMATASLISGVDVRLGGITLGGRAGVGPFATSDGGETGFDRYREAHFTLPIRPGAALRISRRSMTVFGDERLIDPFTRGHPGALPGAVSMRREPKAVESSILLVSSPRSAGPTLWDFAASTGRTSPGGPIGSSRMLRTAAYSRLSAQRDLPWSATQLEITWTASAHESVLASQFRGYDGNYRSKTINGYGAALTRKTGRLLDHFSARYGVGLEVADWRDEHQLLTRDGKPLAAGIERAIALQGALRVHLGRSLAIESAFEKLYWSNLDLGETRIGIGLVLAR